MQQPPASDAADEPNARPKVLRRPAQFSRKAAPAAADDSEPVTAPAPRVAEPAATGISWQEDGRFGIALLIVVAVVNLALSFLLPLIHPAPPKAAAPSTTTISGRASMPAAISNDKPSDVTVYSEPHRGTPEDAMDLDALPEGYNEFSTSPADMPPPTARRIEGDQP